MVPKDHDAAFGNLSRFSWFEPITLPDHGLARDPVAPRDHSVFMMNFLFGTVAGGIIACVVTISAARHPEVQARLGLVTPALAAPAPMPAAHTEIKCPSPKADVAAATIGRPDMLFEKKRFWYVAPERH